MNTQIKYSTLLIFLIVPILSFAQHPKYLPGYIITNSGDTIHGFIQDRKPEPFGKIYKKIRYKEKLNTFFKTKYNAYQIAEYKRGDTEFVSMWVQVSSFFLKQNYTSVQGLGEKVFLKVVISDYLSYYKWEYIDGESGYFDAVNLLKRADEPEMARVNLTILGLYKKNLINYFDDCPELVEKIMNKEIETPVQITTFYNNYMRSRE